MTTSFKTKNTSSIGLLPYNRVRMDGWVFKIIDNNNRISALLVFWGQCSWFTFLSGHSGTRKSPLTYYCKKHAEKKMVTFKKINPFQKKKTKTSPQNHFSQHLFVRNHPIIMYATGKCTAMYHWQCVFMTVFHGRPFFYLRNLFASSECDFHHASVSQMCRGARNVTCS